MHAARIWITALVLIACAGVATTAHAATGANFSVSGSTLNLDLLAGANVAVVANVSTYTLTLSGTDTWSGTDSANATGNGSSTLTATKSAFTNLNFSDSGAGTAVSLSNNAGAFYASNIGIVLDAGSSSATVAGALQIVSANSTLALTADTINLNAEVLTQSHQTYVGAVSLGADVVLDAILNGDITFNGTIDGAQSLSVNTGGITTFFDSVGNTTRLTGLTTDAAGTTIIQLNGSGARAIDTNGPQTYNDAVTFDGVAIFDAVTSGPSIGDIRFASTLDGGNLIIDAQNSTTFNGPVGATTPVFAIQVISSSTLSVTAINGGSITAEAGITIKTHIVLDSATDATVFEATDSNGTITLGGNASRSLRSASDGQESLLLSIGGPSGNLTINSVVGDNGQRLKDLIINAPAPATINLKAPISTTGEQTYNGAVTLGADVALDGSANGDISFNGTIDGAQSLSVNTGGVTSFFDSVGDTTRLTGLTTDAAGTTQFQLNNSGAQTIRSFGPQTYNDPVAVISGTGAIFNASTAGPSIGDIRFASTLDGGNLIIDAQNSTTFSGPVGETTPVFAIQVFPSSTLSVTAINGGSITAESGIFIETDIVLDSATDATVLEATDSSGLFLLGLNASRSLRSASDGQESLFLSIGGPSGDLTINSMVGDNGQRLKNLVINSPSPTTVAGGSIHTSGTQTYNTATTLTADTTLSGSEINFSGGAGSVSGSSLLTLAPTDASAAIVVGNGIDTGAAALDITDSDIAALADGFSDIRIGDAVSGSGAVTVFTANFVDSIAIVGGSISVSGLNSAANAATLTARTGAISDRGNTSVDITAGLLEMTAATGIGAGNGLETAVSNVEGQSGTGGVYLNNTGPLTVGAVSGSLAGISTTVSGGIGLNSSGDLTLAESLIAAGGGDIDLTTNGIAILAPIQSSGHLAIIPRTAATSIGIGGGSGTLNLTDGELAQLVDGFSAISIGNSASGSGAVAIDSATFFDPVAISGGSIAAAELNAGANAVTLTANTGAISDGGNATTDVSGGSVALVAQNGAIGTVASPIRIAADSLSTNTQGGNGNQYLGAVGSLIWNSSSAGNGSISLTEGLFASGIGQTIGAANTFVSGGATLGGHATINAAVTSQNSGTLAPGSSPGILSTGNLECNIDCSIIMEVNGSGAVAGADYDQINVSGSVILAANANLNLSGTASGVADEATLVLINNDGADAVLGTFSGLPEGTSVTVNSQHFRISYAGGDGNDVVLAADSSAPGVTIEREDDPTNDDPIVYFVVFSELVTGFDQSDVTIAGIAGTPVVTVIGSGDDIHYTVEVSGMVDGETVVASIPAGAAQDLAGNDSEASTSTDNSVLYDISAPSVTINQAAGQDDPTSISPIRFDVVFSEAVGDLTAGNVSITGIAGTPVVNVTDSGDATHFTVEVAGMVLGETVAANIPADVTIDLAGNANLASTSTDNSVFYNQNTQPGPDYVVNTDADTDDGYCDLPGMGALNQDCTLREAINAANADVDASEITFDGMQFGSAQTITLGGSLPTITSKIRISGPGRALLTVSGDDSYRVLTTSAVADLTLDDLKIAHGGGSGNGAAVAVNGARLTANNSAFSDNLTTGAGGAITIGGGSTVVINNTLFTGNSGSSGGAINSSGTLTLIGCVLSNNASSATNGGAINVGGGTTLLRDSVLSANSSASRGGGIGLSAGRLIISGSTFSSNLSNSAGGAIYSQSSTASPLTVINSSFQGNQTEGFGGGIASSKPATVINSTFSGNAAGSFGGNIATFTSTAILDLDNSIVVASNGGGDCVRNGAGTINARNSLIGDGLSCVNGINSNNLSGDAMLGPLADNGGPTPTMALLAGSPAINAGDNALAVDADSNPLGSDQRGAGFNRILGAAVDMGAYEYLDGTAPMVTGFAVNSPSTSQSIAISSFGASDDVAVNGYLITESATPPSAGDPNWTPTAPTSYTVAADGNYTLYPWARDASNNVSAVYGTPAMVSVDTVSPIVTINQAAGQNDPTQLSPIAYTVVFSEAVTGFDQSDVSVSGIAGTPVVSVINSGDDIHFTVQVSGMASGETVVASLPAGAAQDTAGNVSLASTSTDNAVTYQLDSQPGADFVVNSSADSDDGYCDLTGVGLFNQDCTLREAINAANANADTSIISFAADYTITLAGSALPTVSSEIRIVGNGADHTLIQASSCNPVTLPGGCTPATHGVLRNTDDLVLEGLTIAHGRAIRGGGVDNDQGFLLVSDCRFSSNLVTGGGAGGAIYNRDGEVAIQRSAIVGNSATNAALGLGGGISNQQSSGRTAMLTLSSSTIANNIGSAGGGLYTTGNLLIVNSTIAENTAAGEGSGIRVALSGVSVVIINSTVTGNRSLTEGSNRAGITIVGSGNTLSLRNSIVANTLVNGVAGVDVIGDGVISTLGANLVESPGAITNLQTVNNPNVLNLDPNLAALTDNGGPTQTLALLIGSAAIDVGDNSQAIDVDSNPLVNDQRGVGFARINGGTVDLGAYEFLDTVPPTVDSFAATSPSTSLSIAVTDFVASDDVAITGYLITESATPPTAGDSGWTPSAPTSYTVVADGDYTLYPWARDSGDNVSAVFATPAMVSVDTQAPGVTINQGAAQADPSNVSPIVFDVVYSEAVSGFDAADVAISGISGTPGVSVINSGDDIHYSVLVTGMASGETVIASIVSSAAQDAAGNLSSASTSTDNSVLFDSGAPSVTINQGAGQADPTASSPIVFDVVFSEAVSGFGNADIAISGVAGKPGINVSNSGDDVHYTLAVTGMTDGETVTASIPANAAQDAAGNLSTASTSTDNSVTYQVVVQAGPDFVVNSNADSDDGFCSPASRGVSNGDCTLREAITAANANSDASFISFANSGVITLDSALPIVSTEIILLGNGAASTRIEASACNPISLPGGCAPASYRVLHNTSVLTFDGLTIAHGNVAGDGGGVYNDGGTLTVLDSVLLSNAASGIGGGLHNRNGAAIVSNTTINANLAGKGGQNDGGGIANQQQAGQIASLSLSASILSANSASRSGGGLHNLNGSMQLINSTVSGNASGSGGAGIDIAGSAASVSLRHSTVAGNSVANSGTDHAGVRISAGNTLSLSNSLVADTMVNGSAGVDVASSGTVTTIGNNLVEAPGAVSNLHNANNASVINADPALDAPADNGGLTLTRSLLPGSPALNGGSIGAVSTLNYDQRGPGYPRTLDGMVDLGAYQHQNDRLLSDGMESPP